jgi:hypothetical protein
VRRPARLPLRRAAGVAVAICALAGTATALAVSRGPSDRAAKMPAPKTHHRLTYFDDVQPILASHCTGCHYDGGIAPFALTSYRAAYAHRAEVAQAVRTRMMPPWLAQSGGQIQFRDNPSLSNREISTIVRWAARGAPMGKTRKIARPAQHRPAGMPSRVDLRLAPAAPYRPKPVTDDYHCFAYRWPLHHPTYVTGLAAQPGQPSEVHHVAVYLLPPAYASLVDHWDAAEPGEGYTCFGGPSGRDARIIPVQLLGGWTPGSLGGDFPAGNGILVRPGSRVVEQVHYNLQNTRPTSSAAAPTAPAGSSG